MNTTIVRYEWEFEGEPQEVGLFTGLSDIGIPESIIDNVLMAPFKGLTVPQQLICERCQFWFTEEGDDKYAPGIYQMQEAAEPNLWSLFRKEAEVDLDSLRESGDLLYEDENQIAITEEASHNIIFEGRTINMREKKYEELKNALLTAGKAAIEDFLGYSISDDDFLDVIEDRLDEVEEQMPDDVFNGYYKRYVKSASAAGEDNAPQSKAMDVETLLAIRDLLEKFLENAPDADEREKLWDLDPDADETLSIYDAAFSLQSAIEDAGY